MNPRRWMAVACLTGLCLGWARGAAAQSVRAPYLQLGTPDSVRVVWRTAAAEDSVVCWGDTPDSLVARATGASEVTDHEVAITGLEPETRYHYAVSSNGACPPPAAGDPEDYFRTAPPVGGTAPFTMWVVGDSGTGSVRQRGVFEAMLAEVGDDAPDLFLHVGDMAYGSGTTSEFDENFFDMYAPLLRHTVTWAAMGNHEGRSSTSSTESGPYYDAYVLPSASEAGGLASGTEAYYAFDYGNVHFVVLDSHQSSRDVDGPMLTWLSDDLASTDADWIIAFWHHPPYTKGSHDSDTEGALIDMRENAMPILEAAGVDVVLTGHSHIYERSHLIHGAYDTPTTASGHIVDPGDGRPDGDGAYAARGDGTVQVVAGHGGTGVGGDATTR
ncbi:MAG: metallophosphoesterase [Sandaracinaceae bacterium]